MTSPQRLRFAYWRDPLCLASWGAYALNRYALKPWLGPGHTFVHGHLNDLLLVPSALPPLLGLHRLWQWRAHDLRPSAAEIAGHLLFWSFFFEYFGPRFLHHSTGDWGDVLSYWVGGLVAWGLWSWRYRGATPTPAS